MPERPGNVRRLPHAPNRYRQVRLTYTEEASGRLSVSLYVKPLGASWDETQCLFRWSVDDLPPAPQVEDVVQRLVYVLQDAFPGVTH